MYSTIPIHWNIKSAPASPGKSRVGPALYVFSLLDKDHAHVHVKVHVHVLNACPCETVLIRKQPKLELKLGSTLFKSKAVFGLFQSRQPVLVF
jgi:hypothetical protein